MKIDYNNSSCTLERLDGALCLVSGGPDGPEAIIEATDLPKVDGHAWILEEFVEHVTDHPAVGPVMRATRSAESETGIAELRPVTL